MKSFRALLLLSCLCGPAHAVTPALTVIATDPADTTATLAQRERFYVALELPPSSPAGSVSIEPYDKGAPVSDGIATSAAAPIPQGGGRSALYFFYWGAQPAHVDEVKFIVGDKAYTLPVDLTLSPDVAATPRTHADWVNTWEQQHTLHFPTDDANNKSALVLSIIFIVAVFIVAILAFFILRKLRKRSAS